MSTKKDKFSSKDKSYMKLAINLARARKGLTGENPSVGCVIVKNKEVINSLSCKMAIKKANSIMGTHGRILVRKSGTEPKIRIMAESNNRALISKCINLIKKSIK